MGTPATNNSRLIPISAIRRDGDTQHRIATNRDVIDEYSALMREGVAFPAVRVWWDGNEFWLSDGFQRIEAALRAGLSDILAEIQYGSLSDAKWDSYAANSTHGMRRTSSEMERVVQLTLDHPNSATLSNIQLARYLKSTRDDIAQVAE